MYTFVQSVENLQTVVCRRLFTKGNMEEVKEKEGVSNDVIALSKKMFLGFLNVTAVQPPDGNRSNHTLSFELGSE